MKLKIWRICLKLRGKNVLCGKCGEWLKYIGEEHSCLDLPSLRSGENWLMWLGDKGNADWIRGSKNRLLGLEWGINTFIQKLK